MAGTSIEFDAGQVNRLAVTLTATGAKTGTLASAAVRKTAYDVERDAKAYCPVDTGNLRSSISTSTSNHGLEAEVGPTASYAPYVELGTSRMAPEAFMGPAFDRHAHELEQALLSIADIEAL